jgi:Zn-dependent membrane protease YugP
MNSFPQLFIGCAFAATTIFSLVTLPVEYDASHRALTWLESKNACSKNMKGPRCSDMGCENLCSML